MEVRTSYRAPAAIHTLKIAKTAPLLLPKYRTTLTFRQDEQLPYRSPRSHDSSVRSRKDAQDNHILDLVASTFLSKLFCNTPIKTVFTTKAGNGHHSSHKKINKDTCHGTCFHLDFPIPRKHPLFFFLFDIKFNTNSILIRTSSVCCRFVFYIRNICSITVQYNDKYC